jgi:hypothetical protein
VGKGSRKNLKTSVTPRNMAYVPRDVVYESRQLPEENFEPKSLEVARTSSREREFLESMFLSHALRTWQRVRLLR